MDVLEIPGYAEAVVKERIIRDASFLGITESVGPFEVVPMTLRHYLTLRIVRSPLINRRTPTPDDVVNFLWLLSPRFTTIQGPEKRRHIKACRRLFFPPRYLPLFNTAGARARYKKRCDAKQLVAAEIITKAREYVDESLQDMPPARKMNGFEAEHLSDGAYFCAVFGREYGWSQDETLNTPIKRVFQYCNELKIHHGSKAPLNNPSDRVKNHYLRSLASNRKGGCRD